MNDHDRSSIQRFKAHLRGDSSHLESYSWQVSRQVLKVVVVDSDLEVVSRFFVEIEYTLRLTSAS